MDLYEELQNLVHALNADGVDYAICGDVALALHGYPRYTNDIDLLIQPDDLDQVIDVAKRCGLLEWSGELAFKQCDRRRVLSKTDGTDYLVLDLVLVSHGLEAVWQSRVDFDWQGGSLRIVSADGLAKMKRMSGQDQDLLDLEKLGFIDEQTEEAASD